MYPNHHHHHHHPNPNQSEARHHSTTAGGGGGGGSANHQPLTRYDSAPSSVFDSSDIVLSAQMHSSSHEYGHSATTTNSSSAMAGFGGIGSSLTMGIARGVAPSSGSGSGSNPNPNPMLPPGSSSLIRHSSSPAGFLQHLTSDTGFTFTKGGQSYSNPQATSSHGQHKQSRLGGSQLSFTNQVEHHQPSLKRASSSHSTSSNFSIGPWENNDSLVFGGSTSKRGKHVNDDLLRSLSAMDSQMELSEMGGVDNMMHVPEDSVACKVRAKRGFATHPRSIAERERRTRISGKLKKLQELVPNMDKQTSYSEMLDLAIQHITNLQFKIQELNNEVSSCTCGGCKPK